MTVYFIKSGDRVKIGFTKNLNYRLQSLQAKSAERLEVVRQIPGLRHTEQWLHAEFADLSLGYEWFRFEQRMLTVLPPEGLDEDPHAVSGVVGALLQGRMAADPTLTIGAISAGTGLSAQCLKNIIVRRTEPNAMTSRRLCHFFFMRGDERFPFEFWGLPVEGLADYCAVELERRLWAEVPDKLMVYEERIEEAISIEKQEFRADLMRRWSYA